MLSFLSSCVVWDLALQLSSFEFSDVQEDLNLSIQVLVMKKSDDASRFVELA